MLEKKFIDATINKNSIHCIESGVELDLNVSRFQSENDNAVEICFNAVEWLNFLDKVDENEKLIIDCLSGYPVFVDLICCEHTVTLNCSANQGRQNDFVDLFSKLVSDYEASDDYVFGHNKL